MLRLALIAKAAKTRRLEVEDALVTIIMIVIAVVCVSMFLAIPIVFIIGAAKVIGEGFVEVAAVNLGGGALGVLFSYAVGLTMLTCNIENRFFPDYERAENYIEAKKKYIKCKICLILALLAFVAVVVLGAVIAFTTTNIILAGIILILIGSFSIISIVAGVLSNIFWG